MLEKYSGLAPMLEQVLGRCLCWKSTQALSMLEQYSGDGERAKLACTEPVYKYIVR